MILRKYKIYNSTKTPKTNKVCGIIKLFSNLPTYQIELHENNIVLKKLKNVNCCS